MNESSVAQIVEAVKGPFDEILKSLPDEEVLRLPAMEGGVRAILNAVRDELWTTYAAHLAERAEAEAATCRCGKPCERQEKHVEVTALGTEVSFNCTYYYCRPCREGVAPVRRWLGIHDRMPTMALERAVTALTTEVTFGETQRQMWEQHGQELDRTRLERITYATADEAEKYLEDRRKKATDVAMSSARTAGAEQLVLTADGGGIPCGELVRPAPDQAAERTPARNLPVGTRTISKREGRVVVVHRAGVVTERTVDLHIAPHDAVEVSGLRMFLAAVEAGLRDNTSIHGVFDMGPWIHGQFEDQFQEHSHSAVADICHVTEYMAAAGKVILDSERGFAWAVERKEMLLAGKVPPVLASLSRHRCTEACPRDEHGTCLVLAAKRYLTNHRKYLNYPDALARNLPVGSGEAESTIRHIIRKRMDVAGAWNEPNANRLLGLLTIRHSGWWDDFWSWRDSQDLSCWHQRQRGELKSRFRGRTRRTDVRPRKRPRRAAAAR